MILYFPIKNHLSKRGGFFINAIPWQQPGDITMLNQARFSNVKSNCFYLLICAKTLGLSLFFINDSIMQKNMPAAFFAATYSSFYQ